MPARDPAPDDTLLHAHVKSLLERLRLRGLEESLDEILAWARKERPSAIALLERALAVDADRTQQRAVERRLLASGLPDRPTLETFDWDFQPSLDKALVLQLAELDFLRSHEDLVLTGNSGTGKSHIVKAIAVRAALAGYRVLYRRFRTLMDELYAALADGSYDATLARLARFDLLLIDDVGLGHVRRSPEEPTCAHMLFALMDQRVGKTSTAITSNILLSAWGPYLGDAALTMAILDRVIHHATRIEIDGPSYRDRESQALNQSRRAAARARAGANKT
jgi:DNA replication protein DnaC